jgi:hypothetical protein
MAADLAGDEQGSDEDLTGTAAQWLTRARALRDETERVDDTLREAAESVKLNPRALVGPSSAMPVTETTVALRGGVEALEHAALTLRGLARSVLDSAGIASECSPIRDSGTRVRLASVLAKLGEAIRTYGRLVQATPAGSETLEARLAAQLYEALRLQDELADLLRPRARHGGGPSEWPLRGEILAHVDRLRTGLSLDTIQRGTRPPEYARRSRSNSGSLPKARPSRLRPPAQLLRGSSRPRNSAHRPR